MALRRFPVRCVRFTNKVMCPYYTVIQAVTLSSGAHFFFNTQTKNHTNKQAPTKNRLHKHVTKSFSHGLNTPRQKHCRKYTAPDKTRSNERKSFKAHLFRHAKKTLKMDTPTRRKKIALTAEGFEVEILFVYERTPPPTTLHHATLVWKNKLLIEKLLTCRLTTNKNSPAFCS